MAKIKHDRETYTIEESYHGYKITYDEYRLFFYATPVDKNINLPNLSDKDSFNLKQRCRQAFSKSKATKFTKIKCINDELRTMQITSIKYMRKGSDKRPQRATVRVSYTDKDKTRYGRYGYEKDIPSKSSPVYEDSPENRTIIEDIHAKEKEIEDLKVSLKLLDPEAVFRQYIEV